MNTEDGCPKGARRCKGSPEEELPPATAGCDLCRNPTCMNLRPETSHSSQQQSCFTVILVAAWTLFQRPLRQSHSISLLIHPTQYTPTRPNGKDRKLHTVRKSATSYPSSSCHALPSVLLWCLLDPSMLRRAPNFDSLPAGLISTEKPQRRALDEYHLILLCHAVFITVPLGLLIGTQTES